MSLNQSVDRQVKRILINAVGIIEGGGATVLISLCNGFVKSFCDVEWHLAIQEDKYLQFDVNQISDDITIHRVAGSSWLHKAVWLFINLPRLIRCADISMVIVFNNFPNPSNAKYSA